MAQMMRAVPAADDLPLACAHSPEHRVIGAQLSVGGFNAFRQSLEFRDLGREFEGVAWLQPVRSFHGPPDGAASQSFHSAQQEPSQERTNELRKSPVNGLERQPQRLVQMIQILLEAPVSGTIITAVGQNPHIFEGFAQVRVTNFSTLEF